MYNRRFVRLAFLIALFVLAAVDFAMAKSATVVLRNGKRMTGDLIEDLTTHVTLANELGEIKICRENIEVIFYNAPSRVGVDTVGARIDGLNDYVVIHLTNGEVVEGFTVAKSPTIIIVQSELGRLTIPKTDVKLVEYVSRAFSERGESVTVTLTSGMKLDGYLYHEDRNTLTVTTNIGRLTINKDDLRSIQYNVPVSFPKPTEKKEAYLVTKARSPLKERPLQKRMDIFEAGFSSRFGENYSTSGSLTYRNRYLLERFQTFTLNGEGYLTVAGFTLNKDVVSGTTVPGGVTATGGASVSTLGVGTPIHLFPTEGSFYEFFITPLVESHLIHTSLKKTYPSFPAFNSDVSATNFKFGAGMRFGLELSLGKNWRSGVAFNMHFIFGASDYNSIVLYAGTRLY